MRAYNFPPTTNTSDWHAPFYVGTNGELVTWHPPDDEILLGLSPDAMSWSDYGSHRTSYPPGRVSTSPAFIQASSNDGSGRVTLINPGLIDIFLPGSLMRAFPPGEVNVSLRFQRGSDQRTNALFLGRLPILHGVI
jgi:hypothetical protein